MASKVKAKDGGIDSPFPMVLGAVDVGSNAVRFAAARFTGPGNYTVLEAERAPVRLGHGVFLRGRLATPAMDSAIGALSHFAARLRELGALRSRAVATSAVREAANGEAFLTRVRREAGFDLRLITGAEEARLVHLAVSDRLGLGPEPFLLADLGGGSVEVSLVDGSGIRWSESHTMGSVRLLEELTARGEDLGQFFALLEEYAATLKIPLREEEAPKGYIATGGNAEALADLANARPDASGVRRLPVSSLRGIIETLAKTPYHRRMVEFGLKPDRADVILPAAIIYARLAELAGQKTVLVPGVGVREGILLDLAAEAAPGGDEVRREKQAFESALTLGRRYAFDEGHGRQVSEFAGALFDQAAPLHGLAGDSRRILTVAALLHDVGSFVSRSGHHKHTQYIISNSPLLGFSPEEVAVVAQVARYHRKGFPRREHSDYQRLSKTDRQRVLALAALLRLADALDREHQQRVGVIRLRLGRSAARLVVRGSGDLNLEAWSIRRRSDFFERVYTKKLTLEINREERA